MQIMLGNKLVCPLPTKKQYLENLNLRFFEKSCNEKWARLFYYYAAKEQLVDDG